MVQEYDFSKMSRIVDVGGAHGAMVSAIAKRYRNLKCFCFDFQTAEQGARKAFRDAGVADRCDFVAGSFFDSVPPGADVYIVSAVLHDWDDERCVQILQSCRRGIADSGKLLIVDVVMPDEKNVHDTYRNFLDLTMLTQTGGIERNEREWRALLKASGFEFNRVIRIDAPQWIVEAVPAKA